MSNSFTTLLIVFLTTYATTTTIGCIILYINYQRLHIRLTHALDAVTWRVREGNRAVLSGLERLERSVESLCDDAEKRKEEKHNLQWSDPDNNGWGQEPGEDWAADATLNEEAEEETEEDRKKKSIHIGQAIIDAALDMFWRRRSEAWWEEEEEEEVE